MHEALIVAFDVIVVIVIFFLAWYVTKFVATRGGVTGKGKYIRVIEKVAVSRDSSMVLVKACGKLLFIGVTPHGMTTLAEFSASDAEAADVAEPEKESFSSIFLESLDKTIPDGKFKDTVDRIINRKGGGGDDRS